MPAKRSTLPIQIAPSILAANFLHLGDAVKQAEAAGADRLHLDVMDGHFVPNLSLGIPVVQAIRGATQLPLEAHLMIDEPERYLDSFVSAGADIVIVHVEVSPHIYRTVQRISELGARAGVAINPGTPISAVQEVLGLADLILVMTVNPGFGGQTFIESMLPKISALRAGIDSGGYATELEVDGGIDISTASRVVAAGARVLVAGTAVYHASEGIGNAINAIRDRGGSAMPSA